MKSQKIIQIIFISLFCILILLPTLRFNRKGVKSDTENRNLATKPTLLKDGNLNRGMLRETDAYIQDRFGLKNRLVTLNNEINFKILKKIGNDRAVIGKDNWLFHTNFSDFLKTNLVDKKTAMQFAQQIKNRADWCKKNGIEFIFLIAPDKHNVYPEMYPFERPAGITRMDQFMKAMDELGVEYIYSRDYLIENKKNFDHPLYFETDTHWNQTAAYLTYQKILEKIKAKNIPFYKFLFKYSINEDDDIVLKSSNDKSLEKVLFRNNIKGDLIPRLGLADFRPVTSITYEPIDTEFFEYYEDKKNIGRKGTFTENKDKSLPKALVFSDSFFWALKPFFSMNFSSVEVLSNRNIFDDTEYILQNKPDIILFEVIEWNIRNINNMLPSIFIVDED
ncbi:MAG: alginate O-acetyltransferase AlgX-related protein [Treponemataceae bacterium]